MNRRLKVTEIVLLRHTEKEAQPHQRSRKCNLKEQDTTSAFTMKTVKKVDTICGRQNTAPDQKNAPKIPPPGTRVPVMSRGERTLKSRVQRRSLRS